MRNKIFGGIGMVWGGLILLNWMLGGSPAGDGAYAKGGQAAVVFGLLMFLAGSYYFFKK